MRRLATIAPTLAIATLVVVALTTSLSAIAGGHSKEAKTGDIVDVAVAAGQFKTLAAALEAADLVDTLKGHGPFTVFAPTDEAFAALPEGTVETLLRPENRDQLVSILTYHVVAGKVSADQVVNLDKADTVNGQSVSISVVDGNVRINDATVVAADVEASNGVIHIVDAVILPQI